jgi:uncharacterized protein with FMN-binding domain
MRRVALALFGTVAGLVGLLSFKTHPASVAGPPAAVSTSGPGTGSSGSPGSGSSGKPSTGASSASSSTSRSAGSSSTSSSSSSSSADARTVTGDAVDTQYGPVQVRITVRNGKVVSATAVDYPTNDPRDAQINAYAIPVLQQESVGVTNSNIDMVSGATFTSEGYVQSLQSALDKAGL